MSFFNSNITGASGSGSGGVVGGLVTKFEKTVTISSNELAEVVINLADDISNYADITNEQIIVELKRVSASLTSNSGYADLSHSYNAVTGDLTITSTTSLMPFRNPSDMEIGVDIYVAGAVQIPPAPETAVYKCVALGSGKYSISSVYADFESVTKDMLLPVATGTSISVSGEAGGQQRVSNSSGSTISLSYDTSTGVATVSGSGSSVSASANNLDCNASCGVNIDVYLVIGSIN